MTADVSPFVPGARVAIYIGDRWTTRGYREDFVHKAHKTGRFTLRSDLRQQWSPSKPWGSGRYWTATQTGDHGWSGGGSLRIWDADSDAEITAEIKKYARYQKFSSLKSTFDRIQFSDLVTEDLLDKFEIFVLGIKPIPKNKGETQ